MRVEGVALEDHRQSTITWGTTGAESDGEVIPVELDVADQRSVREAVATAVTRFGGLDVVVNNAGVMLSGPIVGADTAEWEKMVQVNLLGSLYLTHAALPHLLARKGTVVQISSTSGRIASAMGGVYAETKFGVTAFTESLRQEVTERGVRVVTIEPGMVDTELADHIGDEAIRTMAKTMADSIRTLKAEDVAAAVMYAVQQPDRVAVTRSCYAPPTRCADVEQLYPGVNRIADDPVGKHVLDRTQVEQALSGRVA